MVDLPDDATDLRTGEQLRHLTITPVLARRGEERGPGLDVVERTFALLRWLRRLRIRWEIRDDIHEAFLRLACAIICCRRLRNLTLWWELLGVLDLCFGIAARRDQQVLSQNVAHVDTHATGDTAEQVGDTLAKAFSYDYAKAAETRKVAEDRLKGQALAENERPFAPVKQQARSQKLVLTTTVKSAGVISLSDERIRVLVLADRFAVRAGTDQYGGACPTGSNRPKRGNSWEITSIRVL